MWLPDTNVWIAYLNPKPSPVKQAMRAHPASEIYLCDVVKAELCYGAFKSQRMAANLDVLEDLFQHFDSLPFDGVAARAFGQIRADLQRAGTPIGPYDLQIAAIALARHFTLVTHNTDEFREFGDCNWKTGRLANHRGRTLDGPRMSIRQRRVAGMMITAAPPPSAGAPPGLDQSPALCPRRPDRRVVPTRRPPARFSIHRLAHYCLNLVELDATERVVPVVIFLRPGGYPTRLVLGSETRRYLDFR